MDMSVRHIDADDSFADLDAGAHLLEATGNATGKEMELGEKLVVEVEDIIDLLLGNAEDVTPGNGVDIEESQTMVGLGYTIAGYLACNNLAEYACHNRAVFSVQSW